MGSTGRLQDRLLAGEFLVAPADDIAVVAIKLDNRRPPAGLVPDPPNPSSTTSPLRDEFSISRRYSSTGFMVGWSLAAVGRGISNTLVWVPAPNHGWPAPSTHP
jgi:hypothetical protein